MKTRPMIHKVWLIAGAAAVTALASPSFADDPTMLPPSVRQETIQFVSGGIGSDEEQALKSEAPNYNLHVSDATKAGDFVADVSFVVKSAEGHQLISARDAGPLFFAKLPPGYYRIEAYGGGQKQTREVKISANRSTDLHFIWQSG